MTLEKKYLDKKGVAFFWGKIKEKLENKADILSPEFQGVPLAPTAEKGTATNQVATTKFVKEAIDQILSKINTTQVTVTISPAVQATVTLTNRDTKTTFSSTTDPNTGIAFLEVNEHGIFDITYQSDGIINSVSSINIQEADQIYQISATYTKKTTYTAILDLNNSNPLNCVTYADDALGKTKGSADWDNEVIFRDIKPCIFKDGKVVYYLDKNDCTKQENDSPASLDGTDGDVMVEFSKFAYRIYKDDNNKVYVSITNDTDKVAADNRYHYYAFSKEKEGDCQHFYWGAYKGSLDSNGKLQSIINQSPATNKTLEAFKQAAQSKGIGYSITSYFQLVALQCLYIIKYGNLNGQAALGQGICARSDSATDAKYGPLQTGGTATFSAGRKMYYGDPSNDGSSADYDTAKLGHVKFAGIEDFWGNIWELIDGLTTDANWNVITTWDYKQNFSFSLGLTKNSGGYIKNISGTTETGFIGTNYVGSQTTYFCDFGQLYSNRTLKFGGRWNSKVTCGPFCSYVDNIISNSAANVTARLMYINNN